MLVKSRLSGAVVERSVRGLEVQLCNRAVGEPGLLSIADKSSA